MNGFLRDQKWLKILSIATLVLFSGNVAMADVGAAAGASVDELVKANKELMDQVSQLTKRVSQLENRSERTPTPVAPVSYTTKGNEVTSGDGGIYIGGFVDTSWNMNFDSLPETATGNSTLRAYDREASGFDLNNLQLTIMRPAPEAGGAGFKAELMYGSDAFVTEGADTTSPFGTDEVAIQEAYADIRLPVGNGVNIWAGKFATLIGAEVIENNQNWNASRSLLFQNGAPYVHTGVRATYAWTDQITTNFGIVNGWDQALDNNSGKDFEARVAFTPNENMSFAVTGMYGGSELQDDHADNRGVLDLVATLKPLPQDLPGLSLMAEYLYAFQENPAGDPQGELGNEDWQGYALYAKYDINDKFAVGVRYEQFWDDQAVRTGGAANELWEMSYTFDMKLTPNLLTRLEYRHDDADTRAAFGGGTQAGQNTVGIWTIYNFG